MLSQQLQPITLFVIEVGKALARPRRIVTIECNDLFRRELGMPAERLEDSEDVVVGDRRPLAGGIGRERC